MNLKKFFSELERRKVYKAAIAYGISAWLIAQISGLISDSFELPSWVMQMIIITLIVGFPISMVFSWIFDIGPKGIEKTKQQSPELSNDNNPITGKLVISFLVVISGLIAVGWWSWKEFVIAEKPIKSLAILPFDNYTGNDELEYFVAGMHSSLIGDLGRLSALRVTSKTSSEAFKDVKMSLPEIASELKVDAIIEASVSCIEGDSVCIQIRLVSVFPEEKQLWIEDYYEDKSQILNLYNKVTKQISEEINIVLTTQEENLLAKSRAVDPEAYDAYVKGRYYWNRLSKEDLQIAMDYFKIAVEKDPDWAPPYAGMAEVWMGRSQMHFVSPSVAVPKIYIYMDKALELDPNSANSHYVKALISVWIEWDWEKGEREFLKVLKINPNHAMCRIYYSHFLMIMKRMDEALYQANLALELDPLQPLLLGLYAGLLNYNGDYRSATIHAEKALTIDSDNRFAKSMLRRAYVGMGDYEKSFELWKEMAWWEVEVIDSIEKVFHEQGYLAAVEETIKINEAVEKNGGQISYREQARRYIKVGKYNKAMDYYEKGYEIHDPNMPYISLEYNQMKDNQRYIELIRKMNLPMGNKH